MTTKYNIPADGSFRLQLSAGDSVSLTGSGIARANGVSVVLGMAAQRVGPFPGDAVVDIGADDAPVTCVVWPAAERSAIAPRLQIVGSRGRFPAQLETGTTETRHESQIGVVIGPRQVSNLRLVYCNRYSLGSGIGELDFINGGTQAAYQLEASIASGSVVSPATFRGALRPTLDSGASLTVSDPIGAIVAAGATLQVRTGAIVSAGGSVPATLPAVSNFSKAKSAAGSSQVYTASAFATPGGGSVSTYGVAPVAVLGIPDQRHVSVFAWGDSITYGLSDGTGSAAGSYGWLERGLESVNGTTIPSVNCSRHGETSIVYVDGTSIARTALMEYATHAVFGHGSNNIALGGALPTVQGHCQAIWAQARRMGLKVYHMTLIPRTTSTDAWATAANQTPASGFAAGDKRDQFNSWLRAQAAASVIDGVIDVAAMVEDSANPGKWRTDAGALTGDGIHPNSAGHALMAAALNAAAAGWSV